MLPLRCWLSPVYGWSASDAGGQVLEGAIRGARGMTDAGAREVFFEFNALDTYPEPMYLAAGDARIRIK